MDLHNTQHWGWGLPRHLGASRHQTHHLNTSSDETRKKTWDLPIAELASGRNVGIASLWGAIGRSGFRRALYSAWKAQSSLDSKHWYLLSLFSPVGLSCFVLNFGLGTDSRMLHIPTLSRSKACCSVACCKEGQSLNNLCLPLWHWFHIHLLICLATLRILNMIYIFNPSIELYIFSDWLKCCGVCLSLVCTQSCSVTLDMSCSLLV